jgi:hypothetical protein
MSFSKSKTIGKGSLTYNNLNISEGPAEVKHSHAVTKGGQALDLLQSQDEKYDQFQQDRHENFKTTYSKFGYVYK